MFDLKGKVAIVAGAGSSGPGWGNGKATAVLLARRGAIVFAVDKDGEAAALTRALIEEEGGQCMAYEADVTDPENVREMVRICVEAFDRIDILVNNAGRSEPGGPVDLDTATWDEQLRLNLTSAFLSCKYVIPHMQGGGGGSIVNISSVAGLRYVGKPQVGYAAAKAGLLNLSRTSSVTYAQDAIRINCIVPGLVHTPLVDRVAREQLGGDIAGLLGRLAQQVPMGRVGDAWDVAHAALFLASDEARYITGTEIVVDGGMTASTR